MERDPWYRHLWSGCLTIEKRRDRQSDAWEEDEEIGNRMSFPGTREKENLERQVASAKEIEIEPPLF